MNAALSHVTVWRTAGSGTVHAYLACRHAAYDGHPDKVTMTVATLTQVPAEKICPCLRHRWAGYCQDLGLAPEFKDGALS